MIQIKENKVVTKEPKTAVKKMKKSARIECCLCKHQFDLGCDGNRCTLVCQICGSIDLVFLDPVYLVADGADDVGRNVKTGDGFRSKYMNKYGENSTIWRIFPKKSKAGSSKNNKVESKEKK